MHKHCCSCHEKAHKGSLGKTDPDPFLLPKHYSSEVEITLRNRKMTKESTRSFLSAVASVMLSFKSYPTREEYTRVSKDIILN